MNVITFLFSLVNFVAYLGVGTVLNEKYCQGSPPSKLFIPPLKNIQGQVNLPGSKSISNRCLLLAAVGEGTITLENLLDSDDTRVTIRALRQLGVQINTNWANSQVSIVGNNGPFVHAKKQSLDLGNAGTAMRPLAAILSAGEGEYVLDGTSRMRERPIQDLVTGLRQLGVDVSCSATGCPPVHINAKGMTTGTVEISGKTSSQFTSALLIVAPLCSGAGEISIRVSDELTSAPYVHMTLALMQQFQVHVRRSPSSQPSTFTIPAGQRYVSPPRLFVEGDASSASYFLAAAAIAGGPVTVRGCGSASIQGDTRFAHILEKMGAAVTWTENSITVQRDVLARPLRCVDEDCRDIPDVAMTLAMVAVFCEGVSRLRYLASWRVKETQRMAAMVAELRKVGVAVQEDGDDLVVTGLGEGARGLRDQVCVDTYDDHRMAMCFSLVALAGVGVYINDPQCVQKTFPSYFDVLRSVALWK